MRAWVSLIVTIRTTQKGANFVVVVVVVVVVLDSALFFSDDTLLHTLKAKSPFRWWRSGQAVFL